MQTSLLLPPHPAGTELPQQRGKKGSGESQNRTLGDPNQDGFPVPAGSSCSHRFLPTQEGPEPRRASERTGPQSPRPSI